jgi:ribosomal protein L40E
MDKKTGFKECSRCGLRNKPAAKQCDFCGQRFEMADEWELQIDALEKLSREPKKVEVNEEVTRRIESTIVRKDMVEKRERATEPPTPSPTVHAEPSPPTVVEIPPPERPIEAIKVKKKIVEPLAEMVPEPLPVVVPTPSTTYAAPPAVVLSEEKTVMTAAPVLKKQRVVSRRELTRPGLFHMGLKKKDARSIAFTAILFAGIFIYIAVLAFASSFNEMDVWGLVIIAGGMVVAGFSQVMINWNYEEAVRVNIPGTADDELVEICPSCNERVNSNEEKCPSCGTEFEPSDHL